MYDKIADKMVSDPHFGFLMRKVLDADNQSMSFVHEKYQDVDQWREEARRFIQDKLCYSPEKVSFDEEIVEEEDFGAYTRQKLYFSSAPGYRIPAYVLIPDGLKEPAPAMVVLHNHGGQLYWGKDKSVEHGQYAPALREHIDIAYGGSPVASALARRGYVAIVIDSLLWGERKYDVLRNPEFRERLEKYKDDSLEYNYEYNRISLSLEAEIAKITLYAGYTLMGIRTWDDRATVRYLAGRPEVDAGRIGAIGLSGGGHRSAWLSAMDDRIQCAAIVGWLGRLGEMVLHVPYGTPIMWTVPGLNGFLDYPDIVSMSAPRPLMAIHGTRDLLFNHRTGGDERTSADRAAEKVRKVYEKAGCARNFVWEVFEGPHEFNLICQEKVYAWLDQHLK